MGAICSTVLKELPDVLIKKLPLEGMEDVKKCLNERNVQVRPKSSAKPNFSASSIYMWFVCLCVTLLASSGE